MKKLLFPALLLLVCCSQSKKVGYYVDPNIGGVAPLLTTTVPQVHRPHAMVRIWPVPCSNHFDRFISDRISGIALNMPSYRRGEVTSIMATSGEIKSSREECSSFIDRDFEVLHPWLHQVHLEDWNIDAEWTTTERTAIYRFTDNGDRPLNIFFRLRAEGGAVVSDDGTVVSGYETVDYAQQYFYAVMSAPAQKNGMFDFRLRTEDKDNKLISNGDHGIWLTFDAKTVTATVGISYISMEQARKNLETEIAGRSFDAIAKESGQIWENTLGHIRIEGGTERERRIFYTSLYRNCDRMVNQSEDGRYYSGYDRAVHEDPRPFYNDDWNWDTYRASHALQMILDPQMKADQLQSIVRMYEQWGWVPNFPAFVQWGNTGIGPGGEKLTVEPMVGNHYASVIAEAIANGITDFDIEKAYEGLRKNALEGTMVPWRSGPATELDHFYAEHGFFPGLAPGEAEPYGYVDNNWEKRQSVSVTLEHSYDDWCLAQIAKYLGKQEDYDLLMARSQNYLNLWNPAIRFFAPKNAQGKWIEPFDPELSEGYGGRYYFTEVGGWTHLFNVQHDIPRLIALMGGNEAMTARLDEAFNRGPAIGKFRFLGLMPDGTGLHGMLSMGNEPAFHIPFLYDYAGAPWKTQFRVRQIAELWFDDRPTGLAGDEDGGALCAWYVFAAMGFYPVNPAGGEYALCSPIFSKVSIALPGGKIFTVSAPKASKQNKYIQSATLDGKPLERPFITHADIVNGSTLQLDLGPKPNKSWGK